MVIEDYLPQDGLCVKSYEDAVAIQKILIENDYCVMMSREEDLWVLNWLWSENRANRNDVIFTSRADYECALYDEQRRQEEEEERRRREHLENSDP